MRQKCYGLPISPNLFPYTQCYVAACRLQASIHIDRFVVISRIITIVVVCDDTFPLVSQLL